MADREVLLALAERALVANSASKPMTVTPAEYDVLMRADQVEWDAQLHEAWARTGMPVRERGLYDDILMAGAIGDFGALPVIIEREDADGTGRP